MLRTRPATLIPSSPTSYWGSHTLAPRTTSTNSPSHESSSSRTYGHLRSITFYADRILLLAITSCRCSSEFSRRTWKPKSKKSVKSRLNNYVPGRLVFALPPHQTVSNPKRVIRPPNLFHTCAFSSCHLRTDCQPFSDADVLASAIIPGARSEFLAKPRCSYPVGRPHCHGIW